MAALRFLLIRYPGLVFTVLFIAVMIVIRHAIVPHIFTSFGFVGIALFIGALFAVGIVMERRGY